jgi:molybdopterin-guanine dinucleotide biosynthesis protein A
MTQCYHFLMHRAGFVLAGGQSARMGRDKALLPYGSATLIEAVAGRVRAVVNPAALIGDPRKYAHFGYPVHPDLVPGSGPLGGLHAALHLGWADWNLVVACDMPYLTGTILAALFERAESVADPQLACVVPLTEDGEPEPLCAVYHSSCLSAVERALNEKRRKMKVLLSELQCVRQGGWPSRLFTNVNTSEEWTDLAEDAGR